MRPKIQIEVKVEAKIDFETIAQAIVLLVLLMT